MRPALRPPRLRSGDAIGLVTPSAPVSWSPSPDPHAELQRGIETLEAMGFEVVLGEHALTGGDRGADWRAGAASDRADDINRFFEDERVRAIVATHGGYVSNAVLPHLDYDLIAARPTIIMGFSNMVWLNLAIHARTGLVTFHGNMVIWHLGMDPNPYDLSEIRRVLVDAGSGVTPKNTPWRTVRGGPSGEGRLFGELSGISRLAGTPFHPEVDEPVILFEEGASSHPGITEAVVTHIGQLGVLEWTRGILVGNDGSAFTGKTPEVPVAELLADLTAGYSFPIVQCDDFGHACPNTVLPVGAPARLDPESATLELLGPAVE